MKKTIKKAAFYTVLIAGLLLLNIGIKKLEQRAEKISEEIGGYRNTVDYDSIVEYERKRANMLADWRVEDDTLTIGTCEIISASRWEVPWEAHRGHIRKVIIKSGDTVEGFSDYPALEEVVLPSKLKNINNEAFKSCKRLKSISIPQGTAGIGYSAFEDCSALERVEIPESVWRIEWGAFKNCPLLKDIKLPDGLSELGDEVFKGTSVKSIVLPRKIEKIYNGSPFDINTEVFCYKNSTTAKTFEKVYDRNVIFLNDDNSLYVPIPKDDDFDESRAVQLTDYSYTNKFADKDGYVFMNIDGESEETTRYNDVNFFDYDSVILDPNGAEVFDRGRYTVKCSSADGVMEYPYINGSFIVRVRYKKRESSFGTDVVDKTGQWDGERKALRIIIDDDRYIMGNIMQNGKVSADMVGSISVPYRKISGYHIEFSEDMEHYRVTTIESKEKQMYYNVYTYYNKNFKKEEDPGCEFHNYEYIPPYAEMNENGKLVFKTNKNYVVKGKVLNNRVYYALFKVLEDGETAKDYLPKERPSDRYKTAVDRLTEAGILYNNSNCRYTEPVTALDFYSVMMKAYMKNKSYAQMLEEKGVKQFPFDNTTDPYALLAKNTGLFTDNQERNRLYNDLRIAEAQKFIDDFIGHEGLNISINVYDITGAGKTDIMTREMAYALAYDLYRQI